MSTASLPARRRPVTARHRLRDLKSEVSGFVLGWMRPWRRSRRCTPRSVPVPRRHLSASPTPGQVTSMAVVVATGVTATGGRESWGRCRRLRGRGVWRGLRSLKERGLQGTQLVISDQHTAWWPPAHPARAHSAAGCTSPVTLALVPKSHKDMVAPYSGRSSPNPTPPPSPPPGTASATSSRASPQDRPLMDEAKTEVLAFTAFPRNHWPKVGDQPAGAGQQRDQTPARVVGIFPNEPPSSLVGAILADMHDEWQVSDRPLPIRRLHGPTQTDHNNETSPSRRRLGIEDPSKAHHPRGSIPPVNLRPAGGALIPRPCHPHLTSSAGCRWSSLGAVVGTSTLWSHLSADPVGADGGGLAGRTVCASARIAGLKLIIARATAGDAIWFQPPLTGSPTSSPQGDTDPVEVRRPKPSASWLNPPSPPALPAPRRRLGRAVEPTDPTRNQPKPRMRMS